jgi:hypothetical protein
VSAVLSACGRYRYLLTRGEEPRLAFVMLNPSTADETQDDPTIRRCLSFAQREGAKGIEVANLYAMRSTDPRELVRALDPVGPENDEHLRDLTFRHRMILCAWGGMAGPARVRDVLNILSDGFEPLIYCLGKTKHGQPRHPLYLRADTALERFP